MTVRELDEIMILWWPWIVRRLKRHRDTSWRLGFALSITKAWRCTEWHPSGKQAQAVRELDAEFRAANAPEDDRIRR